MKIILDQKKVLSTLKIHTRQLGNTAEHNPYFLMYADVPKGHNIQYFDFSTKGGIVFYNKGGCWHTISEPIAKTKDKLSILKASLKAIFREKNTKRVLCEDYSKEFRKEIVSGIKGLGLRALRPSDIFYCPIYNLEEVPINLEDPKFKDLRYAQSRFYKKYKAEFKDALYVDKKDLLKLINAWIKQRKAKDEILANDYIKFIENGFPGCDIRLAFFINNVFRGLTAGWRIPNSDAHYLFLNIHDYSDPYLGDFITIQHFLKAKKEGYKFLDFGGSDKSSLKFKNKFNPSSIYKIYTFSIREQDSN